MVPETSQLALPLLFEHIALPLLSTPVDVTDAYIFAFVIVIDYPPISPTTLATYPSPSTVPQNVTLSPLTTLFV